MDTDFEQADEFLSADNWFDVVPDSLSLSSTVMSNDDFGANLDEFIMDALENADQSSAQCDYLAGYAEDLYAQTGSITSTTSTSSTEDRISRSVAKSIDYETGPWTANKIQSLIDSPFNPVGKFLRDANISADIALRTNIMPFLIQVS